MSFFDNLVSKTKETFTELSQDFTKYRSKEFLHATLAASAWISLADGSISAEEKTKMIRFLENHEALKLFSTSEVLTVWKEYVDTLSLDMDIGENKVLESLGKVKTNEAQARMVVRMAAAIASADNTIDPNEQRVLERIVKELGLKAEDFT